MRCLFILTMVLAAVQPVFGDAGTGTVSGTVVGLGTLEAIPGAMVVLDGTALGAITDGQGEFRITGVPAGGYSLRVSSVGYHPAVRPDVMVRPGRTSSVVLGMRVSVLGETVIQVTPDRFVRDVLSPVGVTGFTGEQVRRSPGSAGDVSRVLAALPSVSRFDDQFNGMAVRGGNPMENAVYLDGMQIPNINHFPRQGTSGGGLGMVNTDLVQDVRFSAGGFSSEFGNRLSSLMEIDIREGNREEFDGQVDLSMAGLGTVLEGPFKGGQGSWLICGRRSYVDLLVDIADIDAVPVYSDYMVKTVHHTDGRNRLSLLGLAAFDSVDYTYAQAWEDGNENYGTTENWNASLGAGWRRLWADNGFSNTTLFWNGTHYGGDYHLTANQAPQALQNSTENLLTLRHLNTWQPDGRLKAVFGAEARYEFGAFDNWYARTQNYSGETIPELHVEKSLNSGSGAVFATVGYRFSEALAASAGGRVDRYGTAGRTLFSPRFTIAWEPVSGTMLSAAAGVYRQELPAELLSRGQDFTHLDVPRSIHWVAGFLQNMGEGCVLQAEVYMKTGNGFPLDPEQPGYFILDGTSSEQNLHSFSTLVSGGETVSRGIEVTFQKQLIDGFYGMAAASVSAAEYRNPDEQWRPRIFDNRWTATLEGGYRLDEKWEFSLRWLLAGGRPYTPLDLAASALHNRTVLDDQRINAERYPHYSSLNLRADRRFYFRRTSLVCYASVWNVLGRRNVTATYWNGVEGRPDAIHQWGRMPIVGLEYEF